VSTGKESSLQAGSLPCAKLIDLIAKTLPKQHLSPGIATTEKKREARGRDEKTRRQKLRKSCIFGYIVADFLLQMTSMCDALSLFIDMSSKCLTKASQLSSALSEM